MRDRLRVLLLREGVHGPELLAPALAARLTERFGPVVYNLYGSSETGFAAIATPEDLAAAPGTVGRAPLGVRVRALPLRPERIVQAMDA